MTPLSAMSRNSANVIGPPNSLELRAPPQTHRYYAITEGGCWTLGLGEQVVFNEH